MTQRFCILLHDKPFWHWDFLLENGDHALCWRLHRQPCCEEPIAAEQMQPHRLLYLNFEGPVSGERGTVKRFASGTYQLVSRAPVFVIQLEGVDWAHQASLFVGTTNRPFWRFSVASLG